MPNINFPTSPTIGQIYTFNDISWKWDGVSWVSIVTSAGYTGSQGNIGYTGSRGGFANDINVYVEYTNVVNLKPTNNTSYFNIFTEGPGTGIDMYYSDPINGDYSEIWLRSNRASLYTSNASDSCELTLSNDYGYLELYTGNRAPVIRIANDNMGVPANTGADFYTGQRLIYRTSGAWNGWKYSDGIENGYLWSSVPFAANNSIGWKWYGQDKLAFKVTSDGVIHPNTAIRFPDGTTQNTAYTGTGGGGYTGSVGFTGSIGTTGFTGSIGTTGFTGSIGYTGSSASLIIASVYLNNAANTTNAGWQKIPLDTTEIDTNSIWDSVNKRLVPTKAGYYTFHGRFRTNTVGSNAVAIYKNGNITKVIGGDVSTSTYASGGSAIIYANGTTDYFELFGFASTVRVLTTGTLDNYLQLEGPK